MMVRTMTEYGTTRKVDYGYEDAIKRTKDVLDNHGFGILSEIDVAEKLRENLDVEFDDYRILGACSPAHAYEALQEEQELGLLLPCNVIVYRDGGETFVSVVNPTEALRIADNPSLEPLAKEIEEELKSALDEL